MQLSPSNFVDSFNLMLHRAVAEKLRQNPKAAMQIARKNLEHWSKNKSFALTEWQNILENRTPEEIAKIISQDTDEGQRLRSSSPFAGVLTESERDEIWSECAEIGFI